MKDMKQEIHLANEGYSVAMLIEITTLSISANICQTGLVFIGGVHGM